MHRYRSHTCGALRDTDIDQTVRLSGWCHRIRDHGGVLFIDLRDHYGLTQCVADPDSPAFKTAEKLRSEWVVRIDGKVRRRPEGTDNPELPTGAVELYVSEIEVLGPAGELPMPVFGDQEYPEDKGDKDFTAIVSRMKRENIDLVYVGGYHQESGLIVRQMRDQGMKTVLMAGDALADAEFASITGPAGEGTLFTFGPDPRNKPTAKSIVEKFKANNIDPEGYTLYTYAAMQVWSQAVAKAGTTDPKKVMDTIKAGSWDTVIGKMEFDAKGDIKQLDYVVYKWDAKGGYTEINPKGS